MTFSISIYPDNRYTTNVVRFFMQLSWKREGSKTPGRITRELPETYGVSTQYFNKKKSAIEGPGHEVVTIRDRHFKLKDLVNNQKGTFEENLREISILTGVVFDKKTTQKTVTIREAMNMIRLTDFILQYAILKSRKLEYNSLRKYQTLVRNIQLFCLKNNLHDNMHKLSKDQQTMWFSQYIDFLLHDEVKNVELQRRVLEEYKDGDTVRLRPAIALSIESKGLYQNDSVREDFKLLTAVKTEFEETGLKVKMDKLVADLPTAEDPMPQTELNEIMEMWANRDMPGLSTEERKSVYLGVFQFFVGLRQSELIEVREHAITTRMVSGKTFPVLNYVSGKGKNARQNSVPLNSICMQIIEYWKTHPFKIPQTTNKKTGEVLYHSDCLLPVIPATKYNKALHKFMERLPLFQKEEQKIRYRGDVKVVEKKKRWEVLTSHSMRHGYSKFLSNNGMNLDDVGKLMNHSDSDTIKNNYEHLDQGRILLTAFEALEKIG